MKPTYGLTALCLILNLVSTICFSQAKEEDILARAHRLYDAKEFEACIQQLNVLHPEDHGESDEVYGLLGACHYELGDYHQSVVFFGIALAKAPRETHYNFQRAFAYLQLQRFTEASRDFEKVLQRPSFGDIGYINSAKKRYADALIAADETEKAIKFLERNHNDDVELLNDLAYYTLEYRDEPDKALQIWEKVANIDPKNVIALENLSIVYSQAGDYNMAFYHIGHLLHHYPNYGRGHYLRGIYLEETGEDGDALQCYERARALGYAEEED